MIGRISGRLDYRADDHVLIDVRGVGYLVYCSERTLAALPGTGEAVSLFTDLLVREDLLQLFGFASLVEKEWHRLLMSVQGVGAKASMAILADGVWREEATAFSRVMLLFDDAATETARNLWRELAPREDIDNRIFKQTPEGGWREGR